MADAAKAMQQWDGQELVGQKLSVKIQTIAAPQQLPGMQPAVDLDERDGEWVCAQPCAGDAVPGAGEVGVCRERICLVGSVSCRYMLFQQCPVQDGASSSPTDRVAALLAARNSSPGMCRASWQDPSAQSICPLWTLPGAACRARGPQAHLQRTCSAHEPPGRRERSRLGQQHGPHGAAARPQSAAAHADAGAPDPVDQPQHCNGAGHAGPQEPHPHAVPAPKEHVRPCCVSPLLCQGLPPSSTAVCALSLWQAACYQVSVCLLAQLLLCLYVHCQPAIQHDVLSLLPASSTSCRASYLPAPRGDAVRIDRRHVSLQGGGTQLGSGHRR